jgi:nucleotide-binding universal stress UspA family protein
LDASPQSVAALRAAAELAALMEAELEGLFIEDINLLHLCGLPFSHEIGSYTAKRRQLDNRGLERQLRAVATTIQRAMTQVTTQKPVRWHFQVRRGSVVSELLAAAQNAALVSVGRAGRVRRRTLGSTARSLVEQSRQPLLILGEDNRLVYPLIVVFTGTPAAERALLFAARLAQRSRSGLRVLLWPRDEADAGLAELEAQARARAGAVALTVVPVRHDGSVLAALRSQGGGTLVLPGEQSALVAEHTGPVLLVP